MSSAAWTKFSSLVWPPRIAEAIISRTATTIEQHRAYLSPYATLERCLTRLEHTNALLRGISPERRRKIQSAAERGVCKYLTDIELELNSLFDEYYRLCMLYKEFPLFQRHIPGTRFHKTLLRFEDEVMVFFKDAWKTTAPGDRAINWGIIMEMNMNREPQRHISPDR